MKQIQLNTAKQVALLDILSSYDIFSNGIPRTKKSGRYYYDNDWYSYGDAITLSAMIQCLKPEKIIEIGSGFTTALMLDVSDWMTDRGENRINITTIDFYAGRVGSLVRETDNVRIISQAVQSVPLEEFVSLRAGDILFVDSSHTFAPGSDLEQIFFKILPALAKGVYIHFHDIEYPFGYSRIGVPDTWNEAYYLKAFLAHNNAFSIVLYTQYLYKTFPEMFDAMPLFKENPGAQIWIKKIK